MQLVLTTSERLFNELSSDIDIEDNRYLPAYIDVAIKGFEADLDPACNTTCRSVLVRSKRPYFVSGVGILSIAYALVKSHNAKVITSLLQSFLKA
jgi:hypothetical protein